MVVIILMFKVVKRKEIDNEVMIWLLRQIIAFEYK